MGQMRCTNMESSQDILLTFQMLQLLGYAVRARMGKQDHWKDTEEPSNLQSSLQTGDEGLGDRGEREFSCLVVF